MVSNVVHRNALPTGARLNGYIIEGVLGSPGGFGIVYLAKNENIGKLVAIKEYFPDDLAMRKGNTVYPKSASCEEDFGWGLSRFRDEAKALVRFKHPNVIEVLDYFTANGTAYMLMPYEDGKPLDEILNENSLTEDELLQKILLPILNGLSHVHDAGFLHRDVKPGNIFMRRSDETPVLLDFGAARNALGNKSKSLHSIVTPGYAPFEQYFSDGNQGPWTDIYALGAVAYRIITGNSPPVATSRQKEDKLTPAIEAGKGRFSKSLLQSIDHALLLNEEDRPQSCNAWIRELTTHDTPPTLTPDPPHPVEVEKIVTIDSPASKGIWETVISKVLNFIHGFQRLIKYPSQTLKITWCLNVDCDRGCDLKTLDVEQMSDTKGLVIGRDGNISHCPIKDPSISSRHCRLMLAEGVLYIEDLNSTNGTILNGEEVEPFQPTQIEHGDELLIGDIKALLVKVS